jgi:hypothetical protein
MRITDCFTEGKIGLIDGTMGSGKTDFACTLMEALIKKKQFKIITNIIFLKQEPNIITCSTAKKLLLNLVETDKTVVVLDEAGLWFSSKEGMTKGNRQLEKLIMLIRKFRSNLIFIAQSYRYIPPIVKDFYTIRASKTGKTVMRIYIRNNGKHMEDKIRDVWPTSLSFDSYSIPYFDFDINLEKLFNSVATIPSNQIKEVMKEELNKIEGEAKEKIDDKTFIEESLRRGIKPRMKNFKLADHAEVVEKTIYNIYSNYKQNSY